mmetsp:Transcript_10316/g.16110  ORF Transcript_10316/g.16110 Transcript_10316/m.16110 type:complete len:223 (-) Transcript_10316:1060-1728(-)|eukprot:CAMPEP_0184293328 /NCGR_PEP_ID=MMETSP1049-20130417/4798_1 /TAXON_ID=77928 /ORGANISM="Proteomonas sulcata, Strain CCMP704" /LENGTH=222 /DNA_ID=CAMNT_0026601287 /DNA_START=115 /DNA_END=783 /DNA_ORIENTATION=+
MNSGAGASAVELSPGGSDGTDTYSSTRSPLTPAEKMLKLESVVERQRKVVGEQRSSITTLMQHVSTLEGTVQQRDQEIAKLTARVKELESGTHMGEEASRVNRESQTKLVAEQELRSKAERELSTAVSKEKQLQDEIKKLKLQLEGQDAAQPLVMDPVPLISADSPLNIGGRIVRDEQLGKVRDNLLAAEVAIEKLRFKVHKGRSFTQANGQLPMKQPGSQI